MKTSYDVIKRPILTEKSYDLLADKTYTFEVAVDANKTEIKQALEEIFDIKVASVNTSRRMGKMKRQGKTQGRRPTIKKAFVKLTKDSKTIEFFDSMV